METEIPALSEVKNIKSREDWDAFVKINDDGYSYVVVVAASRVMHSLDNGDDYKTAHDKMFGMGMSGFQAGCVAQVVAKQHNRGDEFRKAWNKGWGADDAKGTVNPALITIETKE